jgi:adenylate cyclase
MRFYLSLTIKAGVIKMKNFSFDLWGDGISDAESIQSNGITSRVCVSETTYLAAKNSYHFDPIIEKNVDGKKIKSYAVAEKKES